mmetsp:Transcript_50732/g.127288  ORF Transcript_50732/g.127288 Transcript_50732/m.127288 type:complete len:200 (+) Transcript_50732:488-1087(+)
MCRHLAVSEGQLQTCFPFVESVTNRSVGGSYNCCSGSCVYACICVHTCRLYSRVIDMCMRNVASLLQYVLLGLGAFAWCLVVLSYRIFCRRLAASDNISHLQICLGFFEATSVACTQEAVYMCVYFGCTDRPATFIVCSSHGGLGHLHAQTQPSFTVMVHCFIGQGKTLPMNDKIPVYIRGCCGPPVCVGFSAPIGRKA